MKKELNTITLVFISIFTLLIIVLAVFAGRIPNDGENNWGPVLIDCLDDVTVGAGNCSLGTVVSGFNIVDGSVASADITDATITSADIGVDVIAAVDIAVGAVATAEILDDTILSGDIQNGTIGTGDIQDGEVGVADIGADAVNGSELANVADYKIVQLADGTNGWDPGGAATAWTIVDTATTVNSVIFVSIDGSGGVAAIGCVIGDLTAGGSFSLICSAAPTGGSVLNYMMINP